jgi:hypothetical protein
MDATKDYALISNALWEEDADLEKALRDFAGLDMDTRLRIFGGIILQGTLPYLDDKRLLLGRLCQHLEGLTPEHTKNLHHIGKRVIATVRRGEPHFCRREFWMGIARSLSSKTLTPSPPISALTVAIERVNALLSLETYRQGLPFGTTYV